MDVAILGLGLGALTLSSLALSACLRFPSFVGFALAAYLIAWTTVIGTSYLLSIGASLDRASLLGSVVALRRRMRAVGVAAEAGSSVPLLAPDRAGSG